jgi:hypothetical protein
MLVTGCPTVFSLAFKSPLYNYEKKKQLSPKYQVWIDARKRYKLSHAQIQMARELGLNPRKPVKN